MSINSHVDGIKSHLGIGDNPSQFLRGDGTWQSVSGGAVSWGDIQGTVTLQNDLQTVLSSKADESHVHAISTDLTGSISLITQSGPLPLGRGVSGSLSLITNSGQLPGATGISGLISTANLGIGTETATKFLKGDQTWATPSSGPVSATDITGSLSLLSQSGQLRLVDGVIGTLAIQFGGTGASNGPAVYTNLGLMATTNLSGSIALGAQSGDLQLTDVSGTLAVQYGGTGAANAAVARTNLGISFANTTGSVSLGAQSGDLQLTDVTGTLAIVNGGTGVSSVPAIQSLLGITNTPFTTVRKTGLDQGKISASNALPVNQTEFILLANTNYVFEYWVRYITAATTTGLGLLVDTPASPIGVWGVWTAIGSTGGVPIGGSFNGDNTTVTVSPTNFGADQIAYLTGIVMNGSNAGTMCLSFVTEVTGSAATIRTGTCGRIMTIA